MVCLLEQVLAVDVCVRGETVIRVYVLWSLRHPLRQLNHRINNNNNMQQDSRCLVVLFYFFLFNKAILNACVSVRCVESSVPEHTVTLPEPGKQKTHKKTEKRAAERSCSYKHVIVIEPVQKHSTAECTPDLGTTACNRGALWDM